MSYKICDECETVAHCSKHGCIPLQQCAGSGQLSEAQIVAHQQAGELRVASPKTKKTDFKTWARETLEQFARHAADENAQLREDNRVLRDAWRGAREAVTK